MSVKIQDWNPVASNVVLVAQGPDGKPALLAADRPAGANAEELEYNANKQVTSVKYYASFDPLTNTGSNLIATRNIVWHTTGNGAGQPAFIYWS
jgi:hypothetical protein